MFRTNINDNISYLIALYIRLSREDGDDLESESIANQRDYLLKFLRDNNLEYVDIYIDDGFSGGNFNRPGFQRLLRDMESGKINCVITKDLSRLGRDHIETGRYVEKYFPEHNIRYIAINDDIDTFYDTSGSDMMPFRLSMNDMYARDTSKKVKSILKTKKENGDYCGGQPPYGYIKSPDNKNRLIPDPKTAPVVKKVFELYTNGYSTCEIADILTKDGVPTPVIVKDSAKQIARCNHPEIWKRSAVSRILNDQSYLGKVVQNKVNKVSYKSKKRRCNSPDKWIIVDDMHEPLIDIETFELAKKMRNKSNNYSKDRRKVEYPLSGLVFCKDCGASMSISYEKKRDRVSMNCNNYRQYSKQGFCFSHYINYKKLEEVVFAKIREITDAYKKDKDEFINILKKEFINPIDELNEKIKSSNIKIEVLKRKQDSLYDDKFNGVIDSDTYKRLYNNTSEEIKSINNRLIDYNKELEKLNNSSNDYNDYLSIVEEFLNIEEPTKDLIHRIVDKIYITKDKEVEIHYKIGNNLVLS